MAACKCTYHGLVFCFLFASLISCQVFGDQAAWLSVDASNGRAISKDFFGIFIEEINHARAGGIWAELVNNRGFEVGGRHEPSMITPWDIVGDDGHVCISTELSSCFENNKVALRMDVHCDQGSCPSGGVGVYNPGYWGMSVVNGKTYKLVLYTKSSGPLDLKVSLTDENATQVFASTYLIVDAAKVRDWTKMEATLKAKGSYATARLQLTTTTKGTIWLDQVSLRPTDTYKGHGFRPDLMQFLLNLKPRFFRFPGGCFVEGNWLMNAFRWKETVGPWEERPGHMGDVWNYWSDDGIGYLEYLQLAEDLDAEPVWVINNGIAHANEVVTSLIKPFVQEMLDSVEFARGSANSTWGSLRAKMGHPEPFKLNYVAIGNEDCGKTNYRGNYLKFYDALKKAYPDIKAISNCDGSPQRPLDHPADLYDLHTYPSIEDMLNSTGIFEKKPRYGPKV